MSDTKPRLAITELPGYGLAIYENTSVGTERVIVKNQIEAEELARRLADRFGDGRFKVIRQRNSEGRFGV